MLKRADMLWYLQGCAKTILSAIHGALNEEWRARIAWPLQVVYDQGQDCLLGAGSSPRRF